MSPAAAAANSTEFITRKYPRCIATISAGFEKGDFLVREEKGQRVYFDFFEEAFNYIAAKGYSRMPKGEEGEWIDLMVSCYCYQRYTISGAYVEIIVYIVVESSVIFILVEDHWGESMIHISLVEIEAYGLIRMIPMIGMWSLGSTGSGGSVE